MFVSRPLSNFMNRLKFKYCYAALDFIILLLYAIKLLHLFLTFHNTVLNQFFNNYVCENAVEIELKILARTLLTM